MADSDDPQIVTWQFRTHAGLDEELGYISMLLTVMNQVPGTMRRRVWRYVESRFGLGDRTFIP